MVCGGYLDEAVEHIAAVGLSPFSCRLLIVVSMPEEIKEAEALQTTTSMDLIYCCHIRLAVGPILQEYDKYNSCLSTFLSPALVPGPRPILRTYGSAH